MQIKTNGTFEMVNRQFIRNSGIVNEDCERK